MMKTQATFETFVHELSKEMGLTLDPAPGILRLDLNGVPFMIAHDAAQWGEENVAIVCDFGEAPKENRCAILEALLAANRDMHGLHSPVFSMDPGSGHVLAMSALPLAAMDPAQTMQSMLKHVAVVANWKQSYFLETEAA
ncbi:CesT family type III secretion system chaperone [Herbaspirillum chlorophenolicum]|uniref:CesT family type III secretion system chaperone n=1 Tax=Herbaspirillum chlorophenolicum TaxID=211589 RepID=UPI00067CF9CD|nr:CesT family type III secretion system chaperone [Herbaspirillum chlorophenolicum]